MSSNPGEQGPTQSDKAAQEIEALARRTPMITTLDFDESHINRWPISPAQRTRELLYWISGNLPPLDLVSIKLPSVEPTPVEPNADDAPTEFFVKTDVTVSDVVDAIKQQLHPDEQQ